MQTQETNVITKEIVDWFNLEENKYLFNTKELSRRVGFEDYDVIAMAIEGQILNFDPECVDKIVAVLIPLGFKSKYKIKEKNFDYVLLKASSHFKIDKEDIISHRREGELPKIRKYLMKVGSEKLKLSRATIGNNLGGLVHSSVTIGIKTLNGWLLSNKIIYNEYNSFVEKL